MATEKEEILLEIVVSNETATKAIFESQKSIERLKKSQAELNKAREEGNVTDAEYSKKTTAIKVAIDQQKESIRQNEKELRNNIKSQRENNDSLAALRAQLSNSVKEYDNLSKAEREASKGKDLQKSINELTEELKLAEEATGRFQRNVGNYPKQLKELQAALMGLEPGTEEFIRLSKEAGELKDKINDSKEATKAFAAGAKTTQAKNIFTQVGADIADLDFEGASEKAKTFASVVKSITFAEVINGIKSFASALLDVGKALLINPFTAIVAGLAALSYAAYNVYTTFQLLGKESKTVSDALKESKKTIEELTKRQEEYYLRSAVALGRLTEKQAESIKTEGKYAQEKVQLTKQYSENIIKLAQELGVKLEETDADRLRKSKLFQIASFGAATAADELEKQKINKFNEEKKKLENQYFKEILALNKTKIFEKKALTDEGNKEEIEKQKQKNEELKKLEEERLKNQKEIDRQLQDLLIARIQDELDKQIEAEKAKTQRANEDLLFRLKNEKNLTEKARKEINDIIFLNEQALQTKIIELTKLADEQDIKRELDKQTKLIDAKIQLTLKGTEEEKNLLIEKLEIQKNAELNNANLTTVERLAIEQKFLDESDKINADYLVKKYTRLQSQFEAEYKLRLLSVDNEEKLIDQKSILEYEKAVLDRDNLLLLDNETKAALYGNQLNYELAIAESTKRVQDLQQSVIQQQLDGGVAFAKSMSQITATIGNLIFELSNDSYEAALFARSLAIVNIGIALAEGIAGVVKASAKSATVVDLVASIAVGSATVASQILAAKKAFAQTPEPKKPGFATGGLISGDGTGTSDSIEARVSNGESIINANSTSLFSPLLSSLNQIGGGVAFGQANIANQLQGEEMLARAFAKGVAMLPNPVVSVKEINNVNERLTILKEL